MARSEGWYWVQFSSLISDKWEAAKHAGGQWFMADRAGPLPDGVIHTVGPRIPKPDDAWQTVPIHPTSEMIDAVFWAHGQTDVAAVWIDMLSSAPDPGEA